MKMTWQLPFKWWLTFNVSIRFHRYTEAERWQLIKDVAPTMHASMSALELVKSDSK